MAEVAIAAEVGRRSDESDPETARVAQPQPLAAVEVEAQVFMGFARRRRRRQCQPPAHAEMDHQGRPLLDLDQQVLAAPTEPLDAPAGKTQQGPSVERFAQRRGVNPDREHPATGETGLEAPLQHLDLGQLGHRCILPS